MTDPTTRPRLVPELAVSDLAASLRFWTRVAGFGVAYRREELGFAYLVRNGAAVMLEQRDLADRTWETGRLEPPFGRGVNFEIDVPDLQEQLDRVAAAGWALFMAPEEKWYRREAIEIGVRQFLIQDPDGYLLRFSQRIGERSDAR